MSLSGSSKVARHVANTRSSVLFLIARSALGEMLRAKDGPFLARMEAGFEENALS